MSALPSSDAALFAFGPFVLDRPRRQLTRNGSAVLVTPKAFDLLVILVERGGAVVSKETLMTDLWPETAVEEGNLTFQISTLRKALGSEGAGYIATIPGRGYQFVAPLQRLEIADAAETIVEDQERMTITVSESRRSPWMWLAALAIVVLAAGSAALLNRKAAPAPAIRSLAVLPFKPLDAAQRDEALELGMADTLITRLSRMPGIVVRPVSSVRRYSKLEDDPLEAGRSLGVDAVVDGSIQRRGSQMRVTVRLLRTSDGRPVWASKMDESAHDLFAVEDLVADRVARAVAPALSPPAEAQLVRRPTEDAEAYELYLKGRYRSYFDPERAEEFYRRAISRDPEFAAAWAATADLWLFRGRYSNSSPREPFEKARAAATKAVSLDPDLAEGHAALAQVYADHDWDWQRAEREFRRALDLNPNSDVAHGQFAYLLMFRRDFAGALEHARRATEIDPVSPLWAILRSQVLHYAGRHDEAIRNLEETLRLHPQLIPALLHLGLIYTNTGRPENGIAKFREAQAIGSDSTQLLALEAFAHATAGDRESALRILQDIEKRSERESVAASNVALAWTALGEKDRAFAWLERAYDQRIYLLRSVTVQPGFAPLRGDPRYAELVRRMGL
jgi:DNA-binding winged helix-turn-helix (wHTH) protein/TolB-like protein/tetratricopeptide (TPR) repeat protein